MDMQCVNLFKKTIQSIEDMEYKYKEVMEEK